METLNALRGLITQEKSYTLWQNESITSESLNESSFIQFTDDHKCSLSELTPFKSSKGPLTLKSVVYVWESRAIPFSDYLTGAVGLGVTPASVLERTELIEWLKGTKAQCSYLESVTSKRNLDDRSVGRSGVFISNYSLTVNTTYQSTVVTILGTTPVNPLW
jgi:hypothetical protein